LDLKDPTDLSIPEQMAEAFAADDDNLEIPTDTYPGNSALPSIWPYSIPQSGYRIDPDLVAHLPVIHRTSKNANKE
jgi:hypothetical protein